MASPSRDRPAPGTGEIVHRATVSWARGEQGFIDQRYSRVHEWRFDGGCVVSASASPHIVPPPGSDPAAVDPEEAFVAALASCHMLFFLALAARERLRIDRYGDDADGILARGADGRMAMVAIRLRPQVASAADRQRLLASHQALHEAAHQQCFLARSVTANIVIAGTVA